MRGAIASVFAALVLAAGGGVDARLRCPAVRGEPLPYDAEVEWLEATGSQYFDTEYVPNLTTTFSIDIFPTSRTTSCPFGVRDSNTGVLSGFAYLLFDIGASGQLRFDVFCGGFSKNQRSYALFGAWHSVAISPDGVARVDGLRMNEITKYTPPTKPLVIAALRGDTIYNYFNGRIRNLIIDGVRYRTVIKGGHGEIYNPATRRFLPRVGEFVVGPIKN